MSIEQCNNRIEPSNSKDKFRKTHCEKGHLINKGQKVNPEMSEHVYPVKINDEFKKCNICDPTCDFKIMDKRLSDELEITIPKSSNDMFEKVWENLRTTVGYK